MKEAAEELAEAKRLFPDLGRYLRQSRREISRHRRGSKVCSKKTAWQSSPERAPKLVLEEIELLSKRPK